MIDVVIDTNIYRADPKREKAAFRVLTKLAENGFFRIHIPRVVEREFSSQQLLSLESTFGDASKFVSNVRKKISEPLAANVKDIEGLIEALRSKAEEEASGSLSRWADEIGATLHEPQPYHGQLVLDAYFSGGAPFSQPKERKDFPDAFIFESVRDLASEKAHLHVVSGDNNLRAACEKIQKVTVFGSLEDFLKSKPCLDAAHHLEHLEKLSLFRKNIHAYQSSLEHHLNSLLLNFLPYRQFEDPCFKSDDNMGAVELLDDIEDLEILEDEIEVLGVDTLVVPFSCRIGALVYYSIYAAEYWAMSDNASSRISVHHNENSTDHYLEANEDVKLEVQGTFSVSFEFESGDDIEDPEEDFDSYLDGADVTLEDVKLIQVVED